MQADALNECGVGDVTTKAGNQHRPPLNPIPPCMAVRRDLSLGSNPRPLSLSTHAKDGFFMKMDYADYGVLAIIAATLIAFLAGL